MKYCSNRQVHCQFMGCISSFTKRETSCKASRHKCNKSNSTFTANKNHTNCPSCIVTVKCRWLLRPHDRCLAGQEWDYCGQHNCVLLSVSCTNFVSNCMCGFSTSGISDQFTIHQLTLHLKCNAMDTRPDSEQNRNRIGKTNSMLLTTFLECSELDESWKSQ